MVILLDADLSSLRLSSSATKYCNDDDTEVVNRAKLLCNSSHSSILYTVVLYLYPCTEKLPLVFHQLTVPSTSWLTVDRPVPDRCATGIVGFQGIYFEIDDILYSYLYVSASISRGDIFA